MEILQDKMQIIQLKFSLHFTILSDWLAMRFNDHQDTGIEYLSVYVNHSRNGLGVYTRRDLEEGESILNFKGKFISFEESAALGKEEDYSVQVDTVKYLQPLAPARFVNHSCNPNCGLTGGLVLKSIRKIQAEEELTFD